MADKQKTRVEGVEGGANRQGDRPTGRPAHRMSQSYILNIDIYSFDDFN